MRHTRGVPVGQRAAAGPGTGSSLPVATAAVRNLLGCECCGLVSEAVVGARAAQCPRCGLVLHVRKPLSLQRCLAYLLAAVALYLPANLLPVMATTSLLGNFDHTILGGIVELWLAGSFELAIIVFVASIVVPVLKIGVLTLLVVTAWKQSHWRQATRARLYRMVETVGHWSMLDVFVVVMLVGMVRFGPLGSVQPEAGLLAFGGVVVLTMLASSNFDPRLIWPEPPLAHE